MPVCPAMCDWAPWCFAADHPIPKRQLALQARTATGNASYRDGATILTDSEYCMCNACCMRWRVPNYQKAYSTHRAWRSSIADVYYPAGMRLNTLGRYLKLGWMLDIIIVLIWPPSRVELEDNIQALKTQYGASQLGAQVRLLCKKCFIVQYQQTGWSSTSCRAARIQVHIARKLSNRQKVPSPFACSSNVPCIRPRVMLRQYCIGKLRLLYKKLNGCFPDENVS